MNKFKAVLGTIIAFLIVCVLLVMFCSVIAIPAAMVMIASTATVFYMNLLLGIWTADVILCMIIVKLFIEDAKQIKMERELEG